MAPGAQGEEGVGAITKHPSIERHNTDTPLPSAPSPIWRLITPVSTLPSSPPSGEPWLLQPHTHSSSSTHHHIHPHTVGHVRETGRSLELNLIFYSSMKIYQAADYSIYWTDTALELENSYSCHQLSFNTTSFFPPHICNHMCSAGAGAGTIFPLAFSAWWQRCAHHSPLCPQSLCCHWILIRPLKNCHILPTRPIKCTVDLYRGLMVLNACHTVHPNISTTNYAVIVVFWDSRRSFINKTLNLTKIILS